MSKNYKNENRRCAAVTAKMGRCKMKAILESNYCKRHNKDSEYADDDSTFESGASEVIKDIWIGSLDSAQDANFLRDKNIKGIINISGIEPSKRYLKLYKKLGSDYYTLTSFKKIKDPKTGHIKMRDYFLVDTAFTRKSGPKNFYNYMDRGIRMILKAKAKGPVLIHCHMGINRSCSLIVAYLMTKQRYPYKYKDALRKITEANKKRDLETLSNKDFKRALTLYPIWRKNRFLIGGANGNAVRISTTEITTLKSYLRKYERRKTPRGGGISQTNKNYSRSLKSSSGSSKNSSKNKSRSSSRKSSKHRGKTSY